MEGDGEADAGLEDQAHNRQPSNAGIRGNLPEPSAGAGPATPASRAARRWISVVFHILQVTPARPSDDSLEFLVLKLLPV